MKEAFGSPPVRVWEFSERPDHSPHQEIYLRISKGSRYGHAGGLGKPGKKPFGIIVHTNSSDTHFSAPLDSSPDLYYNTYYKTALLSSKRRHLVTSINGFLRTHHPGLLFFSPD
jgi:hypothetical protein